MLRMACNIKHEHGSLPTKLVVGSFKKNIRYIWFFAFMIYIVYKIIRQYLDCLKKHCIKVLVNTKGCMFVPSHSQRYTKYKHCQQKLIQTFEKQLDDHETKYGIKIPDRSVYMEVPWPKNVLQHVLSAYHQRNSFIGSLSRSRTSLNLVISNSNTPSLDRRRSISPNTNFRQTKSAATSATSTTKRGKLTKAQRYGSTSNLKLVSEKISGFSVFNGPEERRDPIMAYDDVPIERVGKIDEEPRKSFERTKVERTPIAIKNTKKINRQSLSDHLFKKVNNEPLMKRSISQQSLKQDIAMEAVVIDMPSLEGKYDTFKSGTTIQSTGSDEEKYFSRWGPIRGSNSYSNAPNVPVSQLSTLNLKDISTDKAKEPPDSIV